MLWFKRHLKVGGIASVSIVFLLIGIALIPPSTADAQGTLEAVTPTAVGVQATPTEDATVTALNKEKLAQEVHQINQQHTWNNWLWSNAATIISSFFSTLAVLMGLLIGFRQWNATRSDTQNKELQDRRDEREKRAEERFQSVVEGLSSERKEAKIGAAILLRTFLRPGHEQFYIQTFDLVVAHLQLRNRHSDTAEPLDALDRALITVFKESFPLARDQLKKGNIPFRPQSLVGRYIQLDNAHLSEADLKQSWMPQASLRHADLSNADLSDANLNKADLRKSRFSKTHFVRANLREVDLRFAKLSFANLTEANLSGATLQNAKFTNANLSRACIEEAETLENADLRGTKGLTREQLAICKAKGAILDEEEPVPNTPDSPPVSTSTPSPNSGGNGATDQQAPKP